MIAGRKKFKNNFSFKNFVAYKNEKKEKRNETIEHFDLSKIGKFPLIWNPLGTVFQ